MCTKSVRIAKITILKSEGIIKIISYERRDYESVDEKSLSCVICQEKSDEKKNSGIKRVNEYTSENKSNNYHSFRTLFVTTEFTCDEGSDDLHLLATADINPLVTDPLYLACMAKI